ncbi:hypothetical protein BGX27_006615, partial [Mortierella sp. AM989]
DFVSDIPHLFDLGLDIPQVPFCYATPSGGETNFPDDSYMEDLHRAFPSTLASSRLDQDEASTSVSPGVLGSGRIGSDYFNITPPSECNFSDYVVFRSGGRSCSAKGVVQEWDGLVVGYYRDNDYKIPVNVSEQWITDLWTIFTKILVKDNNSLFWQPGDVYSIASAKRKNLVRTDGIRKSSGRKIDGIIELKEFPRICEIFAIEVGKDDEDPTQQKVIDDGLKLAKLHKDMLDNIGTLASAIDIDCDKYKEQMAVHGMLISRTVVLV